MRCHLLILIGCLSTAGVAPTSAAAEPVLLPEELLQQGWIQLFDGQTLFGWNKGSDVNWRVEDGAIVADAGKLGVLYTTTQFSDYVLHLEFAAEADTNSGILIHTPPQPNNPKGDCYEVNIAPPDNPFPTGGVVGIWKRQAPLPAVRARWRTYEVKVEGDRLAIALDGEPLTPLPASVKLHSLGRGHIGLQFNHGRIAFRNIRLRPLGLAPMFNGKDLAGWNTKRAEKSRFEVTDSGELQVLDGRGQLETEKTFADFVLQLGCYVNGKNLNSGIFFRCIPGDFMMGYESQIHNGFAGNDPTQPIDCGTGGFFRRQNARRVMAQDFSWFSKTLIADGAHMAAWINGYQVSDWTDTRPAHENPRKGLRLAAGTIAIQGHDPTTDLRFRNLKIIELPQRAVPMAAEK
jgi:3-keto-disaccharide hydrolase